MKFILVSFVDGWRTFIRNCEEIHNNLTKCNCRSHVAENCNCGNDTWVEASTGLNWLLQALESGPTVEERCLAEMAEYERATTTARQAHRFFLHYVKKQCSWKSST